MRVTSATCCGCSCPERRVPRVFVRRSLGDSGGSGDPADENDGNQAPAPQNDLTDEEITMMAMRASQFYNTDTTLEEAYGIPRDGPPRRQEEEEEGDFQ